MERIDNQRRRIGILNNELYLGQILYNRQRFLKDPETGKRIARPNPEHEWVTMEVPELRIAHRKLLHLSLSETQTRPY